MAPPAHLDIVFSFDTTGSMYSWLEEIRGRLQDLIQRLQSDIPGIKVAVVAHGDYCDARSSYVTKWLDLTTNVANLCDFVRDVERTGGGDSPECYELVLREARTKVSWSSGSRRVLVMIGDDLPHEADYCDNKQRIDWKQEVAALAAEGVTVYGVQCGTRLLADAFYQTISVATGGKHLKLADFGSLFDLLMAVCYKEGADTADLLTDYEKEVRARCGGVGIAADIGAIFDSLKGVGRPKTPAAVRPVEPAVAGLKKVPSLTKIAKPKKVTAKPNVKTLNSTQKNRPKRHYARKVSDTKSSNKFKQSNLPLLKRENVPETNFALKSFDWSPWVLALANEIDIPDTKLNSFTKRSTRPGYRLKTLGLISVTKSTPALFEVAVQGQGKHKRRHIVYSAFSARCIGARRWENHLLRCVRDQVDRVLALGFKIFVRWCPVQPTKRSKPAADVKATVHRYDYAWRGRRNLRTGARDLAKGGIVISVQS